MFFWIQIRNKGKSHLVPIQFYIKREEEELNRRGQGEWCSFSMLGTEINYWSLVRKL